MTLITGTATDVPTPLKATLCGLPEALSVMLIWPVKLPAAVGVKIRPIWQLLLGATDVAQSGGDAETRATRLNGAPTLIALSVRLAKPVLVTTTFCVALLVLAVCAAKASDAGARLMPGTGKAVPVPVSVMMCGEPGALLTIVMLPEIAVAVSGVKVMLIGQARLTASEAGLIGQEVVKPKSPLAVMLVIVSRPVPALPNVTSVAGLVVLTVRAPKTTEGGVRVIAGAPATPVTLSATLAGVVVLAGKVSTTTLSVKAAAEAGLAVMSKVQEPAGATVGVVRHLLLPSTLNPAPPPRKLILLIVSVIGEVFVNVAVSGVDVAPTVRLPKANPPAGE